MDREDIQTGLSLGLNYDHGRGNLSVDHQHRRPAETNFKLLERSSSNTVFLEPSLTLGPSDDPYSLPKVKLDVLSKASSHQESSPRSTGSSFSGGHPCSKAIKREIDAGSGGETEKISPWISDDEEDGNTTKKKLRLTKEQSAVLEDKFKDQSTLNPRQKQALAKQLNLRPRQVEVWFQNRRARTKLKQTKVDCELLRKSCKTLTDENRRLQKELQELKMLKLSGATFTMCPSCEKITAATDGAKAGGPNPAAVAASKQHFFNPFAHSAAC